MKKKRKSRAGKGENGNLRPFSLLIKPAGPDCNLRCDYCFYLSKASLFASETGRGSEAVGPDDGRHRMSDEVLETLVRSYMETPQPYYIFNWQGGEPTLMGLDFFRRVLELQKRYGGEESSVINTLQTNGTLIDGEWARFLAENSVLTGVSLDGPQNIHDAYRKDVAGHGSYDRVMTGIEHLRSSNAEFNILSMVTSLSEGEGGSIFDFFRKEGLNFQQYIPCVEFAQVAQEEERQKQKRDEPQKAEILPYTVSSQGWGRFLAEIFDSWYPDHLRSVSIRNFDNILNFLAAGNFSSCTMRGRCDQYFVVEHDGGVYPCDFFVEPHYLLGNIMDDPWSTIQKSPVYHAFASQKSRWNETCSRCEYLDFCSGDCPKLRFSRDRDLRSISYLCEGNKTFFAETLPRFTELARHARRDMLQLDSNVELPPVSRDPEAQCFCGSGKKYKNCHM